MNRSISSRSSPMSCCHSLSMSIQSSKVEMRAAMAVSSVALRQSQGDTYDDFLTVRGNSVILDCVRSSVKQGAALRQAQGDMGGRVVTRVNSFIFTLYGDMVHGGGGRSLGIGALVRLMASFGISEAAVRQAVSRMSRQGWLVAEHRANRAFYSVTERGRRRIEELSPRIYGPVIEWDGRWRILTYTVDEASRDRRDRLRNELAVLGWAPLSNSTWISPADTLEAAREAASAAGALDAIDLFLGEYRGPLGDRELVARCWDLDEIAAAYRGFF